MKWMKLIFVGGLFAGYLMGISCGHSLSLYLLGVMLACVLALIGGWLECSHNAKEKTP